MPIDVTMPDGTVITGVPDGTTKAQLSAKYSAHLTAQQAQPPSPNKADFSQFHNARGPVTTQNAMAPIKGDPQTDMAQRQSDYITGVAEGVPAGPVGLFLGGDIEKNVVRRALSAIGVPVATDTTILPTSEGTGNAMFGEPASPEMAQGRGVGNILGPGVAAKVAGTVAKLAGPLVSGSGPTAAAKAASAAGYVVPPAMASKSPGIVSQGLSMLSGKIKLQQAASAKNQEVTTRLATESLGLPSGTPIDAQSLDAARKVGSQAYTDVGTAVPQITPDNAFTSVVSSLGKRLSAAAQAFPGLVKNKEIEDLSNTLSAAQPFSPQAGLELVRHLRSDASANLKAFNDPAKQALGLAQRQAADAVDDLMERNITAAGKPDIVNAYRDGRQLLARSYDVEAATNLATGEVNARILGALAKKGRPLTGQLKDIADAARAIPKAMQSPEGFGGTENLGVLDALVGVTHPEAIPALLARPGARSLLLSPTYQNALMGRATGRANAFSRIPSLNPFALPNAMGPENSLNRPVDRAH